MNVLVLYRNHVQSTCTLYYAAPAKMAHRTVIYSAFSKDLEKLMFCQTERREACLDERARARKSLIQFDFARACPYLEQMRCPSPSSRLVKPFPFDQ